jgi:AcrR family transcriptional regulator
VSSSSDLTARARIRDAAIALMAERGIDGATIRDIAQAADVSSGLLRHHFGSKEGLRDACDEFALNALTAMGTRFTEMMTIDAITPEVLLMQRYLVRSTMDGSPTGDALFDRLLEYGERWRVATELKVDDPDAFIALLAVMKMSVYTMRHQLSRVLGEDVGTPEGWMRIMRASLAVFSTPLLTPEQAEAAWAALGRPPSHQ